MVTGVDLYSHATSWLRLVMKSVGSLPLSCDVPLRSGTVHVHKHDRRSLRVSSHLCESLVVSYSQRLYSLTDVLESAALAAIHIIGEFVLTSRYQMFSNNYSKNVAYICVVPRMSVVHVGRHWSRYMRGRHKSHKM